MMTASPIVLHPFVNKFSLTFYGNFDLFKRSQSRHAVIYKRHWYHCNQISQPAYAGHARAAQLDHAYALNHSEIPNAITKCSYCGDTVTLDCFKDHMRTRHKRMTSKCIICQKEYYFVNSLIQHMAHHRLYTVASPNSDKLYTIVRGRKARRADPANEKRSLDKPDKSEDTNLASQMVNKRTSGNDNTTEASVCGTSKSSNVLYSFKMKSCFEPHPSQEKKDDKIGYECKLCGETYKNIKIHMVNFHLKKDNKTSKRVTCSVCKKRCQSWLFLKKHYRAKHSEKLHKCHVCSTTFFGKGQLKMHVMKHHAEFAAEFPAFSCEICGGTFENCQDAKKHKMTKHPESLHKCDICNKAFVNESLWERHMKLHSLPPNTCSICGESFASRHFLLKHRVTTHSDRKTNKCSICGKCFVIRSSFNRHVKMHTAKAVKT